MTEELADLGFTDPDEECATVGCGGDCRELLEYPCNCYSCRRDYELSTVDGRLAELERKVSSIQARLARIRGVR